MVILFTFSVYLNPSEVNTSTEYCLVLFSDSLDYTCYIARLGDKTFDGNVLYQIVSRYDLGILFKSSNYRTWTPEQMEDLKFKLNRCKFTTGTTGTVTFANKDVSKKH